MKTHGGKAQGILATIVLAAGLVMAAPTAAPAAPMERCASVDDIDCVGLIQFRNDRRGELFCQTFSKSITRCEAYWPFRNPTVNGHAALSDTTFTWEQYETATLVKLAPRVSTLEQSVERKREKIATLRAKVERLRDRLHGR